MRTTSILVIFLGLAFLSLTTSTSAHLITDNNMPAPRPTAAISSSSKVKPWCGPTTDRDYPARNNGLKFKMVLAYPSDGYDATVASGISPVRPYGQNIENTARRAEAYVAKATKGKMTIRFDRGNSCSSTAVDIATLRLDVDSATLNEAFRTRPYSIDRYLNSKVSEKLGNDSSTRYMIWVEGLVDTPSWGWAVVGGDAATLVLGEPMASNSARYTHVLLHEGFHLLGAVNNRSPFSTPGHHCRQQLDLMCYDDKSVIGMPPMLPRSCNTSYYGVRAPDCGKEDYFNERPARGSWLRSNPSYNVYFSPALMPCSERRSACTRYQKPKRK